MAPAEGKGHRQRRPIRSAPLSEEPAAAEGTGNLFVVSPAIGHAILGSRRKRPWWQTAITALGVIGMLLGVGLWVSHMLIPWWNEHVGEGHRESAGSGFNFPGFNCHFTAPSKSWKRDEFAKPLGIATLLTMQRTNPNGWLALAAQDFKTRAPRDAEVVDDNLQRLSIYFQNLETNYVADEELGDQRVQHLTFQGRVNHVLMAGDCYLLAYKGIVYCLTVWGPAESAMSSREEFTNLHKGFTLLKEREGWTEEQPKEIDFVGKRASYSLRGIEGLWEEWGQPEKVDPKADLVILAKDRFEDKQVDKMAQVTVLLLEPQKDLPEAVKAARVHVEEQHKQIYPITTMAVMRDGDGAQDRDLPVGNTAGHVVKLHVRNGQVRERFLVLAVVRQPTQVIAIQCECDWKRRSFWEADFQQVLRTFSVKEK
jgi:hypothetical protein